MREKRTKAPTEAAPVASYKHKDKRAHIPTQEESVKLPSREKQPVKKKYDCDPSTLRLTQGAESSTLSSDRRAKSNRKCGEGD